MCCSDFNKSNLLLMWLLILFIVYFIWVETLPAVGYLLGCRRASNGFRSIKKENLLWRSRTQFAERGLQIGRRFLFWCLTNMLKFVNWLVLLLSRHCENYLLFTGLDILVRIPCIWFNICRERVPHVSKEVRVWNNKKAVAGLSFISVDVWYFFQVFSFLNVLIVILLYLVCLHYY